MSEISYGQDNKPSHVSDWEDQDKRSKDRTASDKDSKKKADNSASANKKKKGDAKAELIEKAGKHSEIQPFAESGAKAIQKEDNSRVIDWDDRVQTVNWVDVEHNGRVTKRKVFLHILETTFRSFNHLVITLKSTAI